MLHDFIDQRYATTKNTTYLLKESIISLEILPFSCSLFLCNVANHRYVLYCHNAKLLITVWRFHKFQEGLLALIWSIVSILTGVAFLTAFLFAISTQNNEEDDYYNNGYNNNYYNNGGEGQGSQDNEENRYDPEVAVTSRALAFSALWTGVMAALMSVFGTVILGWQSPTGQYYTCCSSSVHRTTPLGLGSFIGALLMFANLTLICSVLFGDFEIRDSREGDDRGGSDQVYGQRENRLSMAFSILCMVLTILYAGFAALTFVYSNGVMDEYTLDEREEAMMLSTRNKTVVNFNVGYDGYIGDRFDVGRPAGFVSPTAPEATLA